MTHKKKSSYFKKIIKGIQNKQTILPKFSPELNETPSQSVSATPESNITLLFEELESKLINLQKEQETDNILNKIEHQVDDKDMVEHQVDGKDMVEHQVDGKDTVDKKNESVSLITRFLRAFYLA